jgi:hypothetical protein
VEAVQNPYEVAARYSKRMLSLLVNPKKLLGSRCWLVLK